MTIHLYVRGAHGPVRIDCTADTLPIYMRGVQVLAVCVVPEVRIG